MPHLTGLRHAAIQSDDPARLAVFYRDVLGMTLRDDDLRAPMVFLSCKPEDEHHDLAISRAPFRHLAFRVESLRELQSSYAEIKARGLAIESTVNFGISVSIFVGDPDGNLIEVYWPTGVARAKNIAKYVDLDMSESAVLEEVDLVTSGGAGPDGLQRWATGENEVVKLIQRHLGR